MGRPGFESTSQSLHELMNMIGNEILSVIDPDFAGNAAERLVLCGEHASADCSCDHEAIWWIITEESRHHQARGAINHERQIRTNLAFGRTVGRCPQIMDEHMYRRLVVNLLDDAVGIMSDGIGQTVAVPKLIFTSICQQPHWCRDL